MTSDPNDITDLDLLAYADGQLASDPQRLAQVKAAIERDPVLAARVRDYEAQGQALREALNPRLEEPVPDRLRDVLEGRNAGEHRVSPAQIAAVLAAVVATGVGGWVAGRLADEQKQGTTMQSFLAQTLNHEEAGTGATVATTPTQASPSFGWLTEQVTFRLSLPDLSGIGFEIVERRTVEVEGRRAARITYASEDGRTFELFLRPRWTAEEHEVKHERVAGGEIAYWDTGPLSTAVLLPDRFDAQHRAAVLERIRAALDDAQGEPVEIDTTPQSPEAAVAGPGSNGSQAETQPLGDGKYTPVIKQN